MSFTLTRRRLMAATATAAALAFAAPAIAQDKNITVMIWGTTWQLVFEEISKNFTAETGIGVTVMTQSSSTESLAKLQAMADKPEVDVWFTTSTVAERAVKDDKLFADLPADKLPNQKYVIEGGSRPRWVAAYGYPLGIVYRPDMVDPPITSWEDLWDPRFAGQIAAPAPNTYQGKMILLSALLAGGSIDNIDPGFEKLEALKPNIAFWFSSDAQARKALAEGEISVLVSPPSGAKTVRDQGVPVKMITPKPAVMTYDVMTMINGPKQDMAIQFINYALSTQSQTMIAEKNQNMPVNVEASVLPELKDQYPLPENTVSFDEVAIGDHIEEWANRFSLMTAN